MLLSRYYLNQKKTLEINPRHPIMKELLSRVEAGSADDSAVNIAKLMHRTGKREESNDNMSLLNKIIRSLMSILGLSESDQETVQTPRSLV